jgi:hypothetical protein
MVTRLDRLARSTRDLLNTLATITDRKAGFRSLGDAWADTTSAHGRLMLTVLAGLAEFERDLIRTRTGEGRERAKARGVKMGRPPKLTPHQVKEALRRRDAGEPMRNIARSYNVSHSTGPSSATAGDNKTVNIPAPTTPEQGRGKGPRALWLDIGSGHSGDNSHLLRTNQLVSGLAIATLATGRLPPLPGPDSRRLDQISLS